MAAKKKTRRGVRYSPEQQAQVLARLKRESYTVVSADTGISNATLRAWAWEAGVTPPDGRRSQPPPAAPKAVPVNGHAKRRATELELRGLRDFLREEVRVLLPAVVREQLASQKAAR
jgi:transposase-like protein